MSPTIGNRARQTSALKKPQSEMMKDYLAHGPMTATERLVAQNGDTLKPSTGMTRGEELCHKAAYLDQLVKQVQGGGSNRSWTSSS